MLGLPVVWLGRPGFSSSATPLTRQDLSWVTEARTGSIVATMMAECGESLTDVGHFAPLSEIDTPKKQSAAVLSKRGRDF